MTNVMRDRIAFKVLRSWNFNWALTRLVSPRVPRRLVIVTGCYNSGTTLLQRILQAHPSLCGIPSSVEGDVLVKEFKKAEDFGWKRMWHQCESQIRRTGRRPNTAKSVLRQWRWWIDPWRGFVEKSVCDMLRLDFYRQSFAPLDLHPQFVMIVRHPLPVVEGLLRRAAPMSPVAAQFKDGRYPAEMALAQWKASARITVSQMGLSDVRVIRYEDLCEEPLSVLRGLLQSIGLDPSLVSVSGDEIRLGDARISVRNNNQDSAKRFSSEAWQELVGSDEELAELLGQFGYSRDIHAREKFASAPLAEGE